MESKKKENRVENIIETEQKTNENVKQIPDTQELPITTASEYNQVFINKRKFLLPSGAVFLVKNVNFSFLIAKSILPLPILASLTEIKKKIGDVKKSDSSNEIVDKLSEKDLAGIEKIINAVSIEAVVEPKISYEESDNTILVDSINFIDKLAIFNECVQGGKGEYGNFFRASRTCRDD